MGGSLTQLIEHFKCEKRANDLRKLTKDQNNLMTQLFIQFPDVVFSNLRQQNTWKTSDDDFYHYFDITTQNIYSWNMRWSTWSNHAKDIAVYAEFFN